MPFQFDYRRYLASKRSADDRALNHYVWKTLSDELSAIQDQPLRVLEIGGGVGTMVERALEWDLFPGDVQYTLLDADPVNIGEAQRRLIRWAAEHGIESYVTGGALVLTHKQRDLTLDIIHTDVIDYLHKPREPFNLIIAHHFLDLVHVPSLLPYMLSAICPGGLLNLTLNFDGLTILEPEIDSELDIQIVSLYHADMDQRMTPDGKPSGDSQAGRHLLSHLRDAGASLLAAGASDWVVVPYDGKYLADEAYFLHAIVDTIFQALNGHTALDTLSFQRWADARHEQIKAGEMMLIVHQLDALARRPE